MNLATYIPALSVGAIPTAIKKRDVIKDKKMTFYEMSDTNLFTYPYLLISAGHNFDKDTKEEFQYSITEKNKNSKIILGDSGGFQIATGAIKYTPEITEKIFNWLEDNSNFAINLDLPPFLSSKIADSQSGSFEFCLKNTITNMQYFEKYQTGKTKYLNVLHGKTIPQLDMWYAGVKDFNFTGGWSFGSSATKTIFTTLFSFFYIYGKKEIEKVSKLPGTKLIHFLGVSSMEIMPILIYIQKKLNDMEFNLRITFDSSSPFMYANFGGYHLKFGDINITNKINDQKNVNFDISLPCNCPVCKNLTWKSLYDLKSKEKDSFSTIFYCMTGLHNMLWLVQTKQEMENVINFGCYDIMQSYFPPNTITAFKVIDKIFLSENPVMELYNNQSVFNRLAVKNKDKLESLSTFFD